MPKVTRKRVTAFASPGVRFGGAVIGSAGLIALGAIFFGLSDTGTIDVSGKIRATDQSGFAVQVNPDGNMAGVNGGLRPLSLDPNATPAPESVEDTAPTPEETPAEPVASSTEEQSTNDAENGGLAPENPIEETPSEG